MTSTSAAAFSRRPPTKAIRVDSKQHVRINRTSPAGTILVAMLHTLGRQPMRIGTVYAWQGHRVRVLKVEPMGAGFLYTSERVYD